MPSPRPNKTVLAGKRVLVAGAGGFIGSHLVEHLLREGARVGGLDLTEGVLRRIHIPDGFEFFRCDLRDSDATFRVFAAFRPQIVFHLASNPDAPEDFEQTQASIDGTLRTTVNVLEGFCRCDQPELLVYGDSTKVYGDGEVPYRQTLPLRPLTSYAIAKAAGWNFCELYRRGRGLPSVSVRPTLLYGPRQSYNLITYVMECVRDGKPEVRLDGGGQTRSPLFIDDAMEAYLALARKGAALSGQVINLSGREERPVRDIAKMVVRLMDSRIPVVEGTNRRRRTEMTRSYGDNEEARRLLGWQPRTDLETGLQITIEHCRNERGR